ncbi:MAG: carboxypeptidase regulatory-like domain-containing protein [Christensenellales bacterium]|jgi:hypothetical protein
MHEMPEKTDQDMPDKIPELPKNTKDKNRENKPLIEKDDIQYNAQDLDQQQRMNMNPVQSNTQNLHIYVSDTKDYSGKITGITYLGKTKEIVANAAVYLFFGNDSKHPVCKTHSDYRGCFSIEELPPGYYNLFAHCGERLRYEAYSIKVLPCQNVHQSVLLKPY